MPAGAHDNGTTKIPMLTNFFQQFAFVYKINTFYFVVYHAQFLRMFTRHTLCQYSILKIQLLASS